MSYDYYYDAKSSKNDAKSSKKSAKTPKGNARTSWRDKTCYLPFPRTCTSSESCWRVRFFNVRDERWVTSGLIGSVRGVCVRDGRCLPRNVLQPYVSGRFEELARNCCQPKDAEVVRATRRWVLCK